MMRHLHKILLFLALAFPLSSVAQTLEITKSFKMNEFSTVLTTYKNEFGYKIKQGVKDNAFPYAVIEVHLKGDARAVTAAKEKLSLDMGALYMVESVTKEYDNKIVFLVSSSVRTIYMTCGDGCEKQAIFEGMQLKPDRIYSGEVRYTLGDNPDPIPNKKQYFTFQVTPSNATVQVKENGEWQLWEKEDGLFSKSLYYGRYSYKVSADRFQIEEGTIELSDTCQVKVVKLLPDYGWLTISSSPISQGASVFLADARMNEPKFIGTIPLSNKELDKGDYTLQIQQNKYKKFTQNLTIRPNETTTIEPVLLPNFVSLTLSTDPQSDLYVDGKWFGKGTWTGTLELGEYSVESRKEHHRAAVKIIRIGDEHANQTLEIDSPTPIYGSLHVKGSPSKASVYVDGEMVGTSPLIVNDLLIGEHEVKVEKDGCAVWKKTVTVADNEECIAKYELEKGVSLERIVLKGMNATNLSVKRAGDETLLFTYDLPKKGPVRLRMSTDGYTYATQKYVKGAVGKEMDKGKQYQITWTIPNDLGRTMKDSLYFQIVALPEFPEGEIKIGSLYYTATDNGTSVEVARPYDYKKRTYFKYKFKKVTIPAEINYKGYKYSVTSIGKDAFYSCDNLTSITIPNSVKSIGSSAFYDCDKLTSITIPNSVTSIGYDAFNATPWYRNYAKGRNVVYIGKILYKHNNANLSSVVVREGTTSITSYAFRDCKFLQSISIPNSVRYLSYTALNGCSSLTKITVADGNPWLDSRDNCNAIIETKTNKLLVGCKNTVIPNSVTSIGSSAFEDCDNLNSITIPNSVTSIGNSAFEDCDNLNSITIPNSVTSIGNSAFEDCENLTSITIPNRVTSIGNSAFEDCENLTSIIIPNSVTSIGDETFRDCINLTSITIPNSVTSIGWWAFNGCDNLSEINLPTGMEDKFNKMKGIKHFYEEREEKYSDGWNYYYGKNGKSQNYKEAVSYFRIAATQGHADAQNFMGVCYYNGEGVDKNYTEAVKWYRKAAEQGNQYAQYNLGNRYYYGEGVTKDYTEAVKWYRKAAEQGNANAQNHLGNRYYNGEGVTKDYTEAVKWYRKAAEQGDQYAQYNLGICYENGNGVTKNVEEAKKWYKKAADQGHSSAKERLNNL